MRLNKKKKSTNISPYPDDVIDRLARAFYPAILACWNSEEGQREFAAWQAEQAHHANNEKQGAYQPKTPGVFYHYMICMICSKKDHSAAITIVLWIFSLTNQKQITCMMIVAIQDTG